MALEGTLQDMSLPDLIQVFRMGPKTGALMLVNGPERGIIYVSEGRMIEAGVVRGAERTVIAAHDEAVLYMLVWDDAQFIFRHDMSVSQRPVRIEHDGEWLVLEGMRRRDDPLRVSPYHTISLETRLQLSPLPNSAEHGVSLDVNQWRILSQVSCCNNLREICEATGIPADKAIRTVAELMAIGLVEVVAPPPPPRASPSRERAVEHRHAAQHAQALTPLAVGANGMMLESAGSSQVGRNLLDAIMRRIRGL